VLKSLLQFVWDKKTPVAVRFDLNEPTIQNVSHNIPQNQYAATVTVKLISLPL